MNTVVEYSKPDQYELAVSISELDYFRKFAKCPKCSLVFSIYSRPKHALDELYENLYRKVGAVPWRSKSNEEMFDYVSSLSPEDSETMDRVAFIKNELAQINARTKAKYALLDVGGQPVRFVLSFKISNGMDT